MRVVLKTKLEARAALYHSIRQFFAARGVLEVETPLLCSHTVTDLHIHSIAAGERHLQTSPEYCMKRLLVAGSGPIYQICKAFRQEESGSNHNPEFSMLEWYRPGFDHHQLMQELDTLVQHLLQSPPADKASYRDCFIKHVAVDPLTCSLDTLHKVIQHHNLLHDLSDIDHDTALQVILTHLIEPHIGQDRPFFIYDFPASQAALAKIRPDEPPVAERFELYYRGFELANGFHELTDAEEQQTRFRVEQEKRQALQLSIPTIDTYFIDALKQGLPNCAGVAVGLDRLLMLLTNSTAIQNVLSFDWNRC